MNNITKIFNVLEQLETKTRPIEKIELLRSIKDYPEFKEITKIVFSRNINTYISYKRLLTFKNGSKQTASFHEFLDLVNMLSHRKITGKNAEIAIRSFLLKCDDFHAKWYRRILGKDLRAGFGENLLKIIYGEHPIEFRLKPMLASPLKDISKDPELFLKKHLWIYEEKIDGLRCLAVITDGTLTCYSRNGKRLYGAEKFLLSSLNEKILRKLNNIVLDGEFYSKNWSKTMTSVFTKNINVQKYIKQVTFNVFDVIPLSAFKKKKYEKPLYQRKSILKKIFKYLKHPFRLVPWKELPKIETNLETVYELSKKFISSGFEGIILKVLNSPYECKRSKSWVKVKFVKTLDLLCTGVEKSYKNKDEISALLFKYKGKTCRVGSGISLKDRRDFFKHPEKVVGKIIEIEYQEESVDGCLRFPVFIRIRPDKDKPDA